MIIDLKINTEISVLLDQSGIEIYVGDEESPTKQLSIDSLVVDFLDSRLIGSKYYDVEDVIEVRDAFQRGLDSLNAAVKNSA